MKRDLCWKRAWFATAILWMLFIWSNSLQTAAESTVASQGVLDLLMPALEWTNVSKDAWYITIRKVAHMTEFALLGVMWSNALGLQAQKTKISMALLLCVLTAVTDETIQLFVPGRSGELRDVGIDGCGGILGIATASLFRKKRKHEG